MPLFEKIEAPFEKIEALFDWIFEKIQLCLAAVQSGGQKLDSWC